MLTTLVLAMEAARPVRAGGANVRHSYLAFQLTLTGELSVHREGETVLSTPHRTVGSDAFHPGRYDGSRPQGGRVIELAIRRGGAADVTIGVRAARQAWADRSPHTYV